MPNSDDFESGGGTFENPIKVPLPKWLAFSILVKGLFDIEPDASFYNLFMRKVTPTIYKMVKKNQYFVFDGAPNVIFQLNEDEKNYGWLCFQKVWPKTGLPVWGYPLPVVENENDVIPN